MPPGPGAPRIDRLGRLLERAVADALGDLLVRVSERDARPDERLRGVGGEEERIRRGLRHPLAVDLEGAHEHGQRLEREPRLVPGREHGRLVLLQVAVVGEREPLHRREQPREAPDRRPRLPAHELGHVRIQLLRHHRRTCCRRLRQPHEAELRRRPEHELLADAGEVREENGCRVEIVEGEVAVRDRIERVAHLTRRRRELERGAGEGACAERALGRRFGGCGEPRSVAVEHLDPREQVVAERDRLSTLQVRVPGHDGLRLRLGEGEDDERERVDRLARFRARIDRVQGRELRT